MEFFDVSCIEPALTHYVVTKTIVSYALFEEAEKYYYEEEDEIPMEYSVALRSVCAMNMGDDDEDADEEYMSMLALDVEI